MISAEAEQNSVSAMSKVWYKVEHAYKWLARSRAALVGSVIMLILVFLAVFGPDLISSHKYSNINLTSSLLPPAWFSGGTWEYPLGTDDLGRDSLSLMIYSLRIAFIVAGFSTIIAVAVGTLIGLTTGYFGGPLDMLLMRVIDVQLSFPYMMLAIVFMALLGNSASNLVLVMAIGQWVSYSRVVRSSVLALREEQFVMAAKAIGSKDRFIILRHLLPNTIPQILVLITVNFGSLVLLEAALSFLGLGIQPPTPSLGGLIYTGRNYMYDQWWVVTFPGVLLMILVLGVNQLGDGLRDLLDPRLRGVL